MYRAGDILVVDDEVNIADLINEVLSEEGYTIRQAHNGSSALAQIQAGVPGLILLDLSMPDMAGTTLLRHIRDSGLTEVPVVIMTAGANALGDLIAQGASGLLAKPFDLEDLVRCVAHHVPISRIV